MVLRRVYVPLEHRAPQNAVSSSEAPTTTSSATLASESPFFPDPSSPGQRGDNSRKEDLSKTVLACLFGVVAVVLIGVLITWRTCHLRRKGRPLRSFFKVSGPSRNSSPSHRVTATRSRSVPRTTGLPPLPPSARSDSYILSPSFLYPSFSPLPAAYREHRRTRAADIDAGGRRASVRDPDDPHGRYGDKDFLPAYDHLGGPPRYVELELEATCAQLQLQTRGLNSGPSEEGPMTPSSQGAHDSEMGSSQHFGLDRGNRSGTDPVTEEESQPRHPPNYDHHRS